MARPSGLRLLSGRHCVVALSGGADSAVAALGSTLHAASTRALHVHHGFAASDELAAAATAIADHLGLDLIVERVTPAGNSETEARAARRPALLAALAEGEWLVTGHTLDDLAETVLMRIIRGTGPDGLAAMTAEDGRILRPLLGWTRAEVRQRAIEEGLPFRDDPENEDPRHLRTRVRTTILPGLLAENPDIVGALARLAARTTPTAHAVPMRLGVGVARLPLPVLAVAGPDRRTGALREAVAAIRPPYPPTSAEVDRLEAVALGEVRRAELDGGLIVLRDRTWLRIGPEPEVPPPAPLEPPMRWGGFAFTAGDRPAGRSAAAVPTGSVVRSPVAADRIEIAGGHKSVGDALGEAGVPRELRPAWPVVATDDGVRWIPLVRLAAGRRVDPDRYLVANARSEEAW
jgi:tRNA(Ile)-lysidine synthase